MSAALCGWVNFIGEEVSHVSHPGLLGKQLKGVFNQQQRIDLFKKNWKQDCIQVDHNVKNDLLPLKI